MRDQLAFGKKYACQIKPENDRSWFQTDHSGRKTTNRVDGKK
jgi:hypothetical protein